MARGQAGAANSQLGKTNAVAGSQQTQADTLENKVMPGYESLMNTGYLSPEDQNAATVSEMGTAEAPFSTAKFEAANRAGATNNASDLTANQDQLALEQGQVSTQAAAALQQQKMANEEAGMYGIAQQEQGNRGEAEGMYGLGPGTLNARAAGESVGQELAGYGNAAANLIGSFKKGGG